MKILNNKMLNEIQAGMRNESFASSRHPNFHHDKQAGHPITDAIIAGLALEAIKKIAEILYGIVFPSDKNDKKDDEKKDAFSKGIGFNLSF